MPDWRQYVHERLFLPELPRRREQQIVDDVARLLDQIHSEALAGGASEAEALEQARLHIPHWESFVCDVYRSERRNARSRLETWQEETYDNQKRNDGMIPRWLSDLGRDLLYGFRMLRKNPGFTVVAVLTLALGIGASTTIFSVVNGVLLRPLPYPESNRVVAFQQTNPKEGGALDEVSPANFLDWKEQSGSFSHMSLMRPYGLDYYAEGEEPEDLKTWLVTDGFFRVLGVNALHGRTFIPEDFEQGSQWVVVFSHRLWQSRFGGDPGLIGQTVTLQREAAVVVGIMPPEFRVPSKIDVFSPRAISDAIRRDRSSTFHSAIGRLRSDITLQQAQSELGTISQRLTQAYPATNEGVRSVLVPIADYWVGGVRPALLLLLGAVGLVLLIACANVANLFLARGMEREKEFSIRRALGAPRGRLVRQMMTESLLIALAGGTAGVVLSYWAVVAVLALSPTELPRVEHVRIDQGVLLFATAISFLTTIVFGLLPSFQVAGTDGNHTLRERGRRTGASWLSRKLRSGLVVSEVALAFILLVGAGLLMRSFSTLMAVELGFSSEKLLALQVFAYGPKYKTGGDQVRFFDQAIERMNGLPGVDSAAAVSYLPFVAAGIDVDVKFTVEGWPSLPPEEESETYVTTITRDYFRTMRIPVIQGRSFEKPDGPDSLPVALINETMARRFFPNENPIGRKLLLRGFQPQDAKQPLVREVVGVVGDIRHNGLAGAPGPEVFLLHNQSPFGSMTFVIRTRTEPTPLLNAAKEQVWEVDPRLTFYAAGAMYTMISNSAGNERFRTFLLGGFAALALLMAVVGLYGVVSLMANQRTHEMGIRIALGARPTDIFRLIVGRGMVLVGLGGALGVAGASLVARFLQQFLFQVPATDLTTHAVVLLVFGVVAFVACGLPARRATRVDPMVALRYE